MALEFAPFGLNRPRPWQGDRIGLALVHDLAAIEAVAEQREQHVLPERHAAGDTLAMPADPGAVAVGAQLLDQRTAWGWMYLSTVLDDFSRYIIAWKLCTNNVSG